MNEEILRGIAQYSDEKLRVELCEKRNEYSEEAVAAMEAEAGRRGLECAPGEKEEAVADAVAPRYGREDFEPFDHTFSQTDILLVDAMFRDAAIPFYVDTPAAASVLPVESTSSRQFSIHVHREKRAFAHELIDAHFSKHDGRYRLALGSPLERIRAFTFHDVHLSERVLSEEVAVEFGAGEKRELERYARRLGAEADSVEATQERLLFYFDNLDDLIAAIAQGASCSLTTQDLLTALEVIQVYCGEEGFPAELITMGDSLLEYILSL